MDPEAVKLVHGKAEASEVEAEEDALQDAKWRRAVRVAAGVEEASEEEEEDADY